MPPQKSFLKNVWLSKWLDATRAVNEATGVMVERGIASGDFRGEHLEHLLLYVAEGLAAARILLMGLGKREELTRTD